MSESSLKNAADINFAQRNCEIARRYAASKEPVASIAKEFGLSAKVVRTIVSAMGVSRATAIDARRHLIAAAIASGRKGTEVAKEFGVSANWARRMAKEING